MGIGWIIYFSYGIRKSRLHKDPIGRFAEVHAHMDPKEESRYEVQDYDYNHERM